MRFACDTGGTFTDLIVEDDAQNLHMFKAATTPGDPVKGVLDALALAATHFGLSLPAMLARGDMLIHGTTHAINAVITGNTAKTAFLTTAGHPDILVLREAGRMEPFNFTVPYPEPYIPRALTFEVPERIRHDGSVFEPLDEAATVALLRRVGTSGAEAVAVCLLWSIANPAHELRVGALIEQHLPGMPYTLSHRLNPALREYRRASASAIDASLKPLMTRYLGGLTDRLEGAGFKGRTLVLTSLGGMLDAHELAEKPIHAINSGPSMAPIAGRHYARLDTEAANVIVADTGGTTYDVSLVRGGRIPLTKETWIGQPYRGHMTGLASIDIKSIGAGGGSIAWVDSGGVLHVGPKSAGAVPGPVCYGAGGTEPTLTDACLALGWLDPGFFLGGSMSLDAAASRHAIEAKVAKPLGLSLEAAAAAIVEVATENMVQAIEDITVNQGIDPADAVLVGGGGAAGLNSVFIARRLGCPVLLIPETGAALSAAGALMSDLSNEYRRTFYTTSDAFDREAVNRVLAGLTEQCRAFADGPGSGARQVAIHYTVEARYAHQVWEIEVPLAGDRIGSDADLARLVEDFHAMHEQIFAVRDPDSAIEFVGWTASVGCRLHEAEAGRLLGAEDARRGADRRRVWFAGHGEVEASVHRFDAVPLDRDIVGPAIVESPFTTVVVDPAARVRRTAAGSLVIRP